MTPKLHFTPFIQIQSILMNFALGDVTIISGRSLLKSYRQCLSLLLVFWDFVRSLNFDVFLDRKYPNIEYIQRVKTDEMIWVCINISEMRLKHDINKKTTEFNKVMSWQFFVNQNELLTEEWQKRVT